MHRLKELIQLPEVLDSYFQMLYLPEDMEVLDQAREDGNLPEDTDTALTERGYKRGVLDKVQQESGITYRVASVQTRLDCMIQNEREYYFSLPKEALDAAYTVMMDHHWLEDKLQALAAGKAEAEIVSPVEYAIELVEKADGIITGRFCDCKSYTGGCSKVIDGACIHIYPKGESLINTPLDRGTCRILSLEEAVANIKKADAKGLVHCLYRHGSHSGMCNCCTCCCYNLSNADKYPIKNNVCKVVYEARIQEDLCVRCGRCIKQCPFEAIDNRDGIVKVDPEKCWGCGVCRSVCNKKAISMNNRTKEEKES